HLAKMTGRMVVSGMPAACIGAVARYLGLLDLVLGQPTEAIPQFEDAMALATRMGAVPELVKARGGLARALLARGAPGDREHARALVAEALESARGLGLVGLTGGLEAMLETAGSATPEAPRVAVVRRDGDGWTLACGTESARLRNAKGVTYLVRLLRRP